MKILSKIVLVLVLVLVLVVFLVGCAPKTTTSEVTISQPADDKTTSTTSESISEETKDTTTEVKETVSEVKEEVTKTESGKSLKDILTARVKYTVDYDLTAAGKTQKMTMLMDLPKFATLMKTEQGDAKTIFDGNTIYVCNNMQGSWQCFKMEAQQPDSVKIEKDVESGNVQSTYLGTCSRAGESGMKYEITTQNVKSTVCYTSDGILLEMTSPQSTMLATKVSRNVDSSEFVPPAAAQDLSQMIPNIPLPTQ